MITVTKVCCQGCGADLQIDETIRFVTCNYCHARLEVVHDATVTHTKQLDHIERTTDQIARKIQVLERQNNLERLDREWEKFRQAVLVRDTQGNLVEPFFGGQILVGILMIGFGISWIVICASNGGLALSLIGLAIIGIAIPTLFRGHEKAIAYNHQRDRYQTARQLLIAQLEPVRKE